MTEINTIYFSPAGWYACWHSGVWRALLETKKAYEFKNLGGASAGCLSSIMFSANIDLDIFDKEINQSAIDYPGYKCWFKMTKIISRNINNIFYDGFHFNYGWQPFGVISQLRFDLGWPFLAARFITLDKNPNFEDVKNLILSSTYIPLFFEKIARWQGKIAFDGSSLLDELSMPTVLQCSPWNNLSPTRIGWIPNSKDEKNIRFSKWYKTKQLFPEINRLMALREAGYNAALEWVKRYG